MTICIIFLQIWFGWVSRGLHRHHPIDGNGKLNLSSAQRNRHSTGGVPGTQGRFNFMGVVPPACLVRGLVQHDLLGLPLLGRP